jgi:hypothetical protein
LLRKILSTLNEAQRRWLVGREARAIAYKNQH